MHPKSRHFIFVCLCLFPIFTFAQTEIFNRTLFLGIRGDDVRGLQKFLNTDTETSVANSGAGSIGNETDYFGSGTKHAVIKFQEKYSADILVPVGLAFGTGIFGEKTRAKVNALIGDASVSNSSQQKEASTTSVVAGKVIVMFPSQYSGKPGTMITVSGSGFTSTDNTIYFDYEHAVIKAVSWNGQSITFRIPDIPKGIYSIFVKNVRGESNKDAFFIVTDGVTPVPKVDSIEPLHVTRGDVVTIKGSGFLSGRNDIRYGAGIFKDVHSADGVSLTFSVPKNILLMSTSSLVKKISLPMWVYVVNVNGVSNGKSFILDL